MDKPSAPPVYNRTFEDFDGPLMQRFRELAYGEDVGQYSWTSADELREFCSSIKQKSEIVDFGCGAGGPLTFIVLNTDSRGVGCDISDSALQVARKKAEEMGLYERISFLQVDCNSPLFLPSDTYGTAISIDVILHLRDRAQFLSQVSRVLTQGGSFIFTDAGVMTGSMTEAERTRRTLFGHTEFVPPGLNEELLARAGFSMQSVVDSTTRLIANVSGRLRARHILSKELTALEGPETFERQIAYLETLADLAHRGVLSRFTYTSSKASIR